MTARQVAQAILERLSNEFSSQELEEAQNAILLAEEALLEALCFDFVVLSPHVDLADLLETRNEDHMLEDLAWSIANDS